MFVVVLLLLVLIVAVVIGATRRTKRSTVDEWDAMRRIQDRIKDDE